MLKIKGNKEFVAWWEHWMARIHTTRTPASKTELANPETRELKSGRGASVETAVSPYGIPDRQTRTRQAR